MNKLQVQKRMQSLVRSKPILESTNDLINDKLNKKESKASLNKKEKDDNGIITTRITPFSEIENENKEEKTITEGMNNVKLNDEKEKPKETEKSEKSEKSEVSEEEKVKIEFDNEENIKNESQVVLKFENEEALHSKEDINIVFDDDSSNDENDDDQTKHLPRMHSYKMALTSKRLCERWLDNMFMVLYEDLRVFSLFQVEVKQPYLIKKFCYCQSAKEWELYGDLALRLGYKNEAVDAFIRSFNDKYSVDCLNKILKIHTEFNQPVPALNIINQLVLVKEYNFDKCYYPNEISNSLITLIENNGIELINNIATNSTHYDLIKPYFTYIEELNEKICEKH